MYSLKILQGTNTLAYFVLTVTDVEEKKFYEISTSSMETEAFIKILKIFIYFG